MFWPELQVLEQVQVQVEQVQVQVEQVQVQVEQVLEQVLVEVVVAPDSLVSLVSELKVRGVEVVVQWEPQAL